MGVRNKKSNDLFFGIMQSPQATLPQDHSPYISSSWVRYTQTLHLPCLWCACGLSDVERWQEEKSGSMQGLPNAFFSNQR